MQSSPDIVDTAVLREQLRHVYWIGGGSGAGKSTIARRLAKRHGLHHYLTDKVMADHVGRSTAKDCPLLNTFMNMDMDERWVNRKPEIMLETFHWFQGEAFGMIVEDLLRLPKKTAVIAEGIRLLPRLVHPLLAAPGRAVWLLPTPGFSQAAFRSRGGVGLEFLERTSEPEKALRNLLERNRLFTERCREETKRLNLQAIEVGTTMSEDSLFGRLEEALGF